MSKDKSATAAVQALLNDKLGINVPSSDFTSMLERLPAAAGLVSKGSKDDEVEKDEKDRKDDEASEQDVKPVVDFWQLPISKGDAAVFRVRLPVPAETGAEKDGTGEGQDKTASGDVEDKSTAATDDASAAGNGTASRNNSNGKLVYSATGTHEVASGVSRRVGASGAYAPTDGVTKLRGTDRAAHTARDKDSSKSGDDAAEAGTFSGTDDDGTESESGDDGTDGESDANDDQDDEEKEEDPDEGKDSGKSDFTMVIDAGLTATDFHMLLEHLDAHDLTVDLFVVTNGAEAHVGGLTRTFQALWLAKADKAEAKLKDRFEKTYFIVHSRVPKGVTKTNLASADAATAKLVAKLDELFKGRVMDTSRFSKPTPEDDDAEEDDDSEEDEIAEEDDDKLVGEEPTSDDESAEGENVKDDDASDGEEKADEDDSTDGEKMTDDKGDSKASPWFPPRGFLAGVDLYQIFAQNQQEELFRLYRECFAYLPGKDDGKDASAGATETKNGDATSGETDAADSETKSIEANRSDGKETGPNATKDKGDAGGKIRPRVDEGFQEQTTTSTTATRARSNAIANPTTSTATPTRARSNATASRDTSEVKKASTSGGDNVKSQASTPAKDPASKQDGGAKSGSAGARDSSARSQASTLAKGPASERAEPNPRKLGSAAPTSSKPSTATSTSTDAVAVRKRSNSAGATIGGADRTKETARAGLAPAPGTKSGGQNADQRADAAKTVETRRRAHAVAARPAPADCDAESGGDKGALPQTDDATNGTAVPPSAEGGDDKVAENDSTNADGDKEEGASDESIEDKWAKIVEILDKCRHKSVDEAVAAVVCVAFHGFAHDGDKAHDYWPDGKAPVDDHGSIGLFVRGGPFSLLTCSDVPFAGEIHIARGIANLLPKNQSLMMHKISSRGSPRSTVNPCASSDENPETEKDLFAVPGFQPSMILASHDLMAQPDGVKSPVVLAITSYLEKHPSVVLISDPTPAGVGSLPHARSFAAASTHADSSIAVVGKVNVGIGNLIADATNVTTDATRSTTDTNKSTTSVTKFTTDATKSTTDATNALLGSAKVENVAGAPRRTYLLPEGIHAHMHGPELESLLVEADAGVAAPQSRHRVAFDPRRLDMVDLMGPCLTQARAAHRDAKPTEVDKLLPFLKLFASVADKAEADVDAKLSKVGSVLDLVFTEASNDVTYKFGNASMSLTQQRVMVSRTDNGLTLLAFDAQLHLTDVSQPLALCLAAPVPCTTATPLAAIKLVEKYHLDSDHVAALLKDHQLFQFSAKRYPVKSDRLTTLAKSTKLSLDFMPLQFVVSSGGPAATLVVDFTCKFDDFTTDTRIQVSSDFVPCSRDKAGRDYSLPVWTVKSASGLDLGDSSKWRNKAWDKIGKDKAFEQSSVAYLDMAGVGKRPSYHLLASPGELFSALTGLDARGFWSSISLDAADVRDVCVTVSSDAAKSQLLHDDLAQVDVTVRCSIATIAKTLGLLRDYQVEGRATFRHVESESKKSFTMTAATLSLVRQQGVDCVLDLPGCPIQGSDPANRGLVLQDVTVHMHPAVSPVATVLFDVANKVAVSGIESSPVSVRDCSGELLMVKTDDGWKLIGGYFAAMARIGQNHSGRVDVRFTRKIVDKEIDWVAALHVERDGEQAEDRIALPNDAMDDDEEDAEEEEDADDTKIALLPALTSRNPSDILQGPGFTILVADVVLGLQRTSDAWNPHGHGKITAAFVVAVHLPGGNKLFDLDGIVIGKISVPKKQDGALAVHLASDVTVSWGDKPDLKKIVTQTRFDWVKGEQTKLELSLESYNLHDSAPEWLQFLLPKDGVKVQLSYLRSKKCPKEWPKLLSDKPSMGADDEKDTLAITDADSPIDQSTTSATKEAESEQATATANAYTSVSEPSGKKPVKGANASISSAATETTRPMPDQSLSVRHRAQTDPQAVASALSVREELASEQGRSKVDSASSQPDTHAKGANANASLPDRKPKDSTESKSPSTSVGAAELQTEKATSESKDLSDQTQADEMYSRLTLAVVAPKGTNGAGVSLGYFTGPKGRWLVSVKVGGVDLAKLVDDSAELSIILKNCKALVFSGGEGKKQYELEAALDFDGFRFAVRASLVRENGRVTGWALAGHGSASLDELAKRLPWIPKTDKSAVDIVLARTTSKLLLPETPNGLKFGNSLEKYNQALVKRFEHLLEPSGDAFMLRFTVTNLGGIHSALQGLAATVFVTRFNKAQTKNSSGTKAIGTASSKELAGKDKKPTEKKLAENDDEEGDKGEQDELAGTTTIGLALTSNVDGLYGASFFQEHNIALVGSVQFGGKDGAEFQIAGLASPPLEITVLNVFTGITGISAEEIGSETVANLLNNIGLALHAVQLASSSKDLHLTVVADVQLGSWTIPLVVMVDKPSNSRIGFRVGCYPAEPVQCLEFLGKLLNTNDLSSYCKLELQYIDVSWNWSKPLKEFMADVGSMVNFVPPASLQGQLDRPIATGWTVKVGTCLVLGEYMSIVGLANKRIESVISINSHGEFVVRVGLPGFTIGPLHFDVCNLFISGSKPLVFGIEVETTLSVNSKPWARLGGMLSAALVPPGFSASLHLLPPRQATITAGGSKSNNKCKELQHQIADPKKPLTDADYCIDLGACHDFFKGLYLGGVKVQFEVGSTKGFNLIAAGSLKVISPGLKRQPSLGIAISLPQPNFFFATATNLTFSGLFAMFITRDADVLNSLSWLDDYLPVLEHLGVFVKVNSAASIDQDVIDIVAGKHPMPPGSAGNGNKFTVAAFNKDIVDKGLHKANSVGAGVLCVWSLLGSHGRIRGIAGAANWTDISVDLEAEIDPIKISFPDSSSPFLILSGLNDENPTVIDSKKPARLVFIMDKVKKTLWLDVDIGLYLNLFTEVTITARVQLRQNKSGGALFRLKVQFAVGPAGFRVVLEGSVFVQFGKKSLATPTPSNGVNGSITTKLVEVSSALPREIAVDLRIWGERMVNGKSEKADVIYCLFQAIRQALTDMFMKVDGPLVSAQEELDKAANNADNALEWSVCMLAQSFVFAARAVVSGAAAGLNIVGTLLNMLNDINLVQVRELHVGGAWVLGESLKLFINFDVTLLGNQYKGGIATEITTDFFSTIASYLANLVVQNVSKMFGRTSVKSLDFQPRRDKNGDLPPAQPAYIEEPLENMIFERFDDSEVAMRIEWAKELQFEFAKLAKTLNQHLASAPKTPPDNMLKEHPGISSDYNPWEVLRGIINDFAETSLQGELDPSKCTEPPPFLPIKLAECPVCQRVVPDGAMAAHVGLCRPFKLCNAEGCTKLLHKFKDLHDHQLTADVDCPACGKLQPRATIAHHVQFECPDFQVRPEKERAAWLVAWPKSVTSVLSDTRPTLALAAFTNSDTAVKSVMVKKNEKLATAESFGALALEPCPFGCLFSWSTWRSLEAHLAECPKRHVQCPIPGCTVYDVGERNGMDWDHILSECHGRTVLQCHLCDFEAEGPKNLVHHWAHVCKGKPRSCAECGILVSRAEEPAHLNLECSKNKVCCPVPNCGTPYIKRDESRHFKQYHPLQIEEVDANSKGGLYGNQVEYGSSIAKAQTRYLAQLTDHTSPETELLSLFQLATEAIAEREEVVTEYPCRAFCGVVCMSSEDEEEHVRTECLLYELPCPLCHKNVRLCGVYEHWSNSCSEATISCPRPGCTSPMVPRRALGEHMVADCSQELAVCPFCPKRMLPSELGSHIGANHSISGPSSLIPCKHEGCGRGFLSGQSYLDHLFTACPGVTRRCGTHGCDAKCAASEIGRHWSNECTANVDLSCPVHPNSRFTSVADWLTHRIGDCAGLHAIDGTILLDDLPDDVTISCPFACGEKSVAVSKLIDHLISGVDGRAPCSQFDTIDKCPNSQCTAEFHREYRAHHLVHVCDHEMETCRMCKQQFVAKNVENHWKECSGTKKFQVASRPFVGVQAERRFEDLCGDARFTWDGKSLVHEDLYRRAHPFMRGTHILRLDPKWESNDSCTFTSRHWRFDTHSSQQARWMVSDGGADITAYDRTIGDLLRELTETDPHPFRVIAMAVFDEATRAMTPADHNALVNAKLLKTTRLQYREAWARIVQLRPGLNGCEIVPFPEFGSGSEEVSVEANVPWA
ncbi:TNF receptor-associated factor 4 [Allomyces arbusculus]|nr:TNF receptor-associated factor 4 [Allomyces arbusculus]